MCVCDLCRKSISPRVGIGQVSLNFHEQSWSLHFTSMWLQINTPLNPSSRASMGPANIIHASILLLERTKCCGWDVETYKLKQSKSLKTRLLSSIHACKNVAPKKHLQVWTYYSKTWIKGMLKENSLTFHHNLRPQNELWIICPESVSMILPTYPGKIPQTSPNPQKEGIPS